MLVTNYQYRLQIQIVWGGGKVTMPKKTQSLSFQQTMGGVSDGFLCCFFWLISVFFPLCVAVLSVRAACAI